MAPFPTPAESSTISVPDPVRPSAAGPVDAAPIQATRNPWTAPRWWAAVEFVGLIAFQAFHQMEHTLEVFEKRLGQEQVHPLLGGVNFEWAHFTGNTLLFACTIAVIFGYGRTGRARWRETNRLAWRIFVVGVAVQGTHVVEHIVRIIQYVNGSREPVGLATRWIDPVWFHWGINMVFFTGLLVGFFGLRVHRDLFQRPPAYRQPRREGTRATETGAEPGR